jgi:acetyl esterase/lipase
MKLSLKFCLPLLFLTALLLAVSCQPGKTMTASPSTSSVSPPAASVTPTPSPAASSLTPPNPARLGTIEKDVVYGYAGNISLKLDVYYPKTASGALPVAVYVHGGAWTQGDKSEGAGSTEIPEMIRRGYLTVSVNYRLAPAYKFPAMIEDVKCAIRYLKANAAGYGLDPDKIGVWGGSAGGHLVSMLGTTDASAGFEGSGGYLDYSSRVRIVCDFFGTSDLNDLFKGYSGPIMAEVFGVTDPASPVLKWASPVTYISKDDPPFLIMQGDKDNVVPPRQSQILYNRLTAGGVTATLVMVKNAGHGFSPSGGLISPSRTEITKTVADFFDKYFK